MASVKKLNSPYTIDTTLVTITGNLVVEGTQTTLETVDTAIKDNIIVLNSGETGSGVTLGISGISVDRGSADDVAIVYDETYNRWRATNDGTLFGNILIEGFTGISIEDDTSPVLGGNLNTNGYSISSSIDNLIFDGNIQINNTLVEPTAVTDATVVYAASPGAGTAGVYVVNGIASNQELITKTRAFGYSLIL